MWKPRRLKTQAQTSIEFLLLLGFMTVVLLSFLTAINARTRDANRQTTLRDLEEVSHVITAELSYAIRFGDGYRRTFELPYTLDGLRYDLQIRGQRDLVVETGELQQLAFLEQDVIGQPRRGPNSLFKGAGGQLFLNVQENLPQIEIDGNQSDWVIRFAASLNGPPGETGDLPLFPCNPPVVGCDSANTQNGPNDNELRDFFAAHDYNDIAFKLNYAPGAGLSNFESLVDTVNSVIFIDTDNNRNAGYVSAGLADNLPATGFGAEFALFDVQGDIPMGASRTEWGTPASQSFPGGLYKYVSTDPARASRRLTQETTDTDDWLLISPFTVGPTIYEVINGERFWRRNLPGADQVHTSVFTSELLCIDPQLPPRRVTIAGVALYARSLLPVPTAPLNFGVFGKNPTDGSLDFSYIDDPTETCESPQPGPTPQRVSCIVDPPFTIDRPAYFCFGYDLPTSQIQDDNPYIALGGNNAGPTHRAYRFCFDITVPQTPCHGNWEELSGGLKVAFEFQDSTPTIDRVQTPDAAGNWIEMNVSFSTMSLSIGRTIHLLALGLDHDGADNKIDFIPPASVPLAGDFLGGSYYLI